MKLYEIINNMDKIHRFGGTTNIKQQLLSSHTLRVATLAWELSKGIKVNHEQLFMRAICHDMEETFCGDIVHPIKKYFNNYKEIVNNILNDKVDDKGILQFFNDDGSIESYLVEIADMIDTPLQALQEVRMGNKTHIRYFDKFHNFMNDPNKVMELSNILTPTNLQYIISIHEEILDELHNN